MQRPIVLVIDGDAARRAADLDTIGSGGFSAHGASSWAEARDALRQKDARVLVVDLSTPGVPGIAELGREVEALRPGAVVVVVGAGASDLEAQVEGEGRVLASLDRRAPEHQRLAAVRAAAAHARVVHELDGLRERLRCREGFAGLVGRSAAIERLREALAQAATDREPVLIVGEAGSGRSLAAKTIHGASDRATGPFVVTHVSAFPEERLGAELFGADERPGGGAIASASGGTLLVDEIDRLPYEIQARLAEAIAGTSGSGEVRWTASTSTDLGRAVETGRIDPALMKRFEAHVVTVPPLRERSEDVVLLAAHFLDAIAEINRLDPIRPSEDALALLERYRWPGNVRELRNALEQAAILCSGGRILPQNLPERIRSETSTPIGQETAMTASLPFRDAKQLVVSRFERDYLTDLMTRNGGNVTAAAQESGMLRSALQRLLRKHDLRSAEFRRASKDRRPAGPEALVT